MAGDPSRSCSACGAELDVDSRFCGECGAVVAETEASGTPTAPSDPPSVFQQLSWPVVLAVAIAAVAIGATAGFVFLDRDEPDFQQTDRSFADPASEDLPTATPAPTPRVPDCGEATHPPRGSAARTVILDSFRRHENYDGLYTVRHITVLQSWAYVEAARFDTDAGERSGPYSGYLASHDGAQWNWRWRGPTAPDPDTSGSPAFPGDFEGEARDVLRC